MPSGVVTEREVALELPDVRDPKLIQHCAKLCVSYNLSAQQLADKWETMQMNSAKASQPMTFDLLGEFEKVLEKVKPAGRSGGTAQKRPLPEARTQPMAPRAASFTKDSAHLLKSVLAGDTPKRGRTERGQPAPVTPILLGAAAAEASPTSSFASRTDAGKVATALNAQLGAAPAIPQVSVSLGEGAAEASRPEFTSFMYERLDERARRMDGAVEALERDLIVQHGSKEVAPAGEAAGGEAEGGEAEGGEAEAGSPAPQGGGAAAEASPTEGGGEAEWPPVAGVVAAGPEAATFVGRVCSDSEGGKLNPQSVWLEGSRSSSGACRARLDLSECAEYALFPGQVVAVRGVNLLGHTIRASRVLCGSPPPNASPPSERDITPEPFNVITATGPFTCSDDLSFAPLDALLEQATSRRALALVLVGPFVEADHPALAAAEVGYEDLFEQRVMLKVEAFLAAAAEASPHAPPHVVLVPSPRDVLASPVYPQPPLPRRRSPEQIAPLLHFAPNPAAIDVGGVRIAVGSLDSLLMIGSAELASAPQPGAPRPDRLLRLASHVLQQRSFLPLLPPPADLPVDMAHNFVAGAIDTRPDILLLPSQLAPFAKVLPDAAGGALCVNAGRLTRNAAGGNYATLSVHPRAQVDGARTSDIAPRVAVEIAKI